MKMIPETTSQVKTSLLKETVIEKTQRLLACSDFATIDELLQQLPSKDAMSLEDVFIIIFHPAMLIFFLYGQFRV